MKVKSTLENTLSGSAVDTSSVASICSNLWIFGYTELEHKFSVHTAEIAMGISDPYLSSTAAKYRTHFSAHDHQGPNMY